MYAACIDNGIMSQGQGMLFMRTSVPEEDLSGDELVHAVAVSVASTRGFWGDREILLSCAPAALYRHLCRSRAPVIQPYLAEVYPSDPLEAAELIIEKAAAGGCRVVTCWDGSYPALLREISRPPIVLYVRGRMDAEMTVAVVGTRRADARSMEHARRISRELAARGFVIVSGMAIGIDREAHLGALNAGGGTIGVLANGIDVVYPNANRDLYRVMESSPVSGLVSEYPPGSMAGRWTFVRRNRIISGLSQATVVVKAGMRSGALITARHAVEQNREVFACPGNSFEDGYAGCHRLIRHGAQLLSNTGDVIEELMGDLCGGAAASEPGAAAHEAGMPPADSIEGRILRALSSGDMDVDSLVRAVNAPAAEVNEAVVALELDGMIVRNGTAVSRH
jgi:DNA processing protein